MADTDAAQPPLTNRSANCKMDINSDEALQLLARLEALHDRCSPNEPWRIEHVPHSYPDGTTYFTHVVKTGVFWNGETTKVSIAKYVTPELAELLVLMRNRLPDLVRWARNGAEDA